VPLWRREMLDWLRPRILDSAGPLISSWLAALDTAWDTMAGASKELVGLIANSFMPFLSLDKKQYILFHRHSPGVLVRCCARQLILDISGRRLTALCTGTLVRPEKPFCVGLARRAKRRIQGVRPSVDSWEKANQRPDLFLSWLLGGPRFR
jgi:hypothetical protein